MGRTRNVRTATGLLIPKLEQEFLAYEPETDTTAADAASAAFRKASTSAPSGSSTASAPSEV